MGSFKLGEKEIKVPVIQGGMGIGISLGNLAGTVAREGGIGLISAAQIGFLEPDFEENPLEANLRAIENQLRKARSIAQDGIVGFNIMTAMRDYEKYVRAAVEAGAFHSCRDRYPPLWSVHWSSFLRLPAQCAPENC